MPPCDQGSPTCPDSQGCVPSHLVRSSHEDLLRKIRDQVAFYFSADNLQTDMYLVSQMDKDRWVPISTIAQFSRVRSLTTEEDLIVEALEGSAVVHIDSAQRKIRAPNTHRRNTLVLRNLDSALSPEEIKGYFGEFSGSITQLRPEIGNNWFVDMRTDQLALDAIEHLRTQTTPDGTLLAVRVRSNNHLRGSPPLKRPSGSSHSASPASDSSPSAVDVPQTPGNNLVYAPPGYVFVEVLPLDDPSLPLYHPETNTPRRARKKKKNPKRATPQQEPAPQGVWSGVVTGSCADPGLRALEEDRLQKARLSMQQSPPTTPPKALVTPPPVHAHRQRVLPSPRSPSRFNNAPRLKPVHQHHNTTNTIQRLQDTVPATHQAKSQRSSPVRLASKQESRPTIMQHTAQHTACSTQHTPEEKHEEEHEEDSSYEEETLELIDIAAKVQKKSNTNSKKKSKGKPREHERTGKSKSRAVGKKAKDQVLLSEQHVRVLHTMSPALLMAFVYWFLFVL
eukprot:TRINITY_DN9186_c0_g1_i1.p1 TRINITY_DN9186_c0_g1~~TRINITY_DN9186_c0_g1_i1.p1  ORF type:complete len:507 (+),score=77.62 TRINITY_DN9186_c0_g1_i1:278-1798(+)